MMAVHVFGLDTGSRLACVHCGGQFDSQGLPRFCQWDQPELPLEWPR
jgi:hypothetical protein